MDILQTIAQRTRERVTEETKVFSRAEAKRAALSLPKGDFPFERSLQGEELSFLCEVKRASPSKWLIAKEFPYLQIASEYECAGASALSVLTEPVWFLGKDEYLAQISSAVSLPCLRKDFTVDEYMIYRAKSLGAKAILLICSLLEDGKLRDFFGIAEGLGLSCLIEAHDEEEIERALKIGGRVIGVNNRNLKNFTVDFSNAERLRSLVPKDRLFVAESGVKSIEDVRALKAAKVDAVLVGEALMRSPDRGKLLAEWRRV